MKLFVLGGTGFIGRALVAEAVKQGVQVTALTRSREGAEALRALGATPVLGSVGTPEAAARWLSALGEADALIDLLQPALPSRITRSAIQQVSRERQRATAQLLQSLHALPPAARPLFVNVSGTDDLMPDADGRIHSDSPLADPPRGFGHIGVPVRRQIEAPGIDATFVMLGTVYGAGKSFGERILPGLRQGRFPILGNGENQLPLVHVEDAARALLHVARLGRAAVRGRSFLVADGSGVTQGGLLRGIAQQMGAPTPRRVPRAVASLMAGSIAVETMTRNLRADPQALLATGFRFRYPSWREGLPSILKQLRLDAPRAPSFGRIRTVLVSLLGFRWWRPCCG